MVCSRVLGRSGGVTSFPHLSVRVTLAPEYYLLLNHFQLTLQVVLCVFDSSDSRVFFLAGERCRLVGLLPPSLPSCCLLFLILHSFAAYSGFWGPPATSAPAGMKSRTHSVHCGDKQAPAFLPCVFRFNMIIWFNFYVCSACRAACSRPSNSRLRT